MTSAAGGVCLEADFLDGPAGALFSVYVAPRRGPIRGGLLHVPALVDEQNKARHLVAAQARALARTGFATLVVDPRGTGDSAGEYQDASWEGWLQDLERGLEILRARAAGPVIVWGLRAGALLAARLAARLPGAVSALLLWGPALRGEQVVRDLARLRSAGALFAQEVPAEGRGGVVEVAGYRLAVPLLEGLESAVLADDLRTVPRAWWLDIVRDPTRGTSPAVRSALSRAREGGCEVTHRAIEGPAFWGSVELEWCQALLDETETLLSRH